MRIRKILLLVALLISPVISYATSLVIELGFKEGYFSNWTKVVTLPIHAKKIGMDYGYSLYVLDEKDSYFIWNNENCSQNCLESTENRFFINWTDRTKCYREIQIIGKLPGEVKDCIQSFPLGEASGNEYYILLIDDTVWRWSNVMFDPNGLFTIIFRIILSIIIQVILLLVLGMSLIKELRDAQPGAAPDAATGGSAPPV